MARNSILLTKDNILQRHTFANKIIEKKIKAFEIM